MTEPNATAPSASAAGGQLSPDQAHTEIGSIRSAALKDPAHPYNDRRHPEHRALHDRVLELTGIADPEPSDADPDDITYTSGPRRSAPLGPIDAAQAKAEIDAILAAARQDPAHPYNDRRHPEHAALHERVLELHGIANPGSDDGDDGEGGADDDRMPAGEQEIDDALRKARVRGEYGSTEDLAAELGIVRGFFSEAGASGPEAAEVVRIFNETSHLPEAKLHDPDRIEQAQQGCIRALKAVWGADYMVKAEAAVRATQKLDGKDGLFTAYLEETRLGDDPRVVRMLADIAERNGW